MRITNWLAACGVVGLLASGCSLGSPVSVTNRPLAEQLDERAAELESLEETPEAVAFTDTWESGTFLRLDTTEGAEPILRSGPGANFGETTRVEAGAEVLATGNQTGEWIHVLYSAFEGWIHADDIEIAIERTAPPIEESRQEIIRYVIASEYGGLNVRSGPGTQHDLLLGTSNGDEVQGTGNIDGAWVEVVVDGTTGWVAGRHVQFVDGGGSPVSAPATAAPRRAPATTAAPETTVAPEDGSDTEGGEEEAPRQRNDDPPAEQAPETTEPENAQTTEAPATTQAPETTAAPAPTEAPATTAAPAPAEPAPAADQ